MMKSWQASRCREGRLRFGLLLTLLFFLSSWVVFAGSRKTPAIHLSSTSVFPGDVVLVSIVPAGDLASAHITWEGQEIPFAKLKEKGGLGAFFAAPQNMSPGPQKLIITLVGADGKPLRRTLDFEVPARKFAVQRLTLPKEKVTLSKEDLDRHQQEKEAIKKALAHPLEQRLWQKAFVPPVRGEVSTPFGVRRILNGQPRNSHSGLDLRGGMGEPVCASSDGVVILTGEHFFSGKSVYIDHGMGLVTMYFHLSEIRVEKGDRVHGGQTIGLLGSTGRSTGPHLHWGLRVHNCPADPLSLTALFPLQ